MDSSIQEKYVGSRIKRTYLLPSTLALRITDAKMRTGKSVDLIVLEALDAYLKPILGDIKPLVIVKEGEEKNGLD